MRRATLAVLLLTTTVGSTVFAVPQSSMCRISGTARGAGVVLPGVVIRASAGTIQFDTTTAVDGRYELDLPLGAFVLVAELTGFDSMRREVSLATSGSCAVAIDFELAIGARTAQPAQPSSNEPRERFQRLDVQQQGEGRVEDESAARDPVTQLLLPPGFSVDVGGEAIALTGSTARVDNGALNDRAGALSRGEFVLPGDPAELAAFGPPPGAAAGGFPGGRGGRGVLAGPGPGGTGGARAGGPGPAPGAFGGQPPALVLGGRGVNQNRFQITSNYTFGGSPLDAAPYQLRPDDPATVTPYTQQNFGVTVGGRLKLPGVLDGQRTSFTASYTGGRGSSLFDQYGTVPTEAARGGDFSSVAGALVDPATGLPFSGNQIPVERMNPAARALLDFIPLPNLPGSARNYHYTTTTSSRSDAINGRITHSFGTQPGGRRGGFGPAGRGGGPGGPAGRGNGAALTAQFQYRQNTSDQSNVFPSLGGQRKETAFTVPLSVNIVRARGLHNIGVTFSNTTTSTQNGFSELSNAALEAGIQGTTADPVGWGVPQLSFSSITGLTDVSPSRRSDRRVAVNYAWTRPLARHQFRVGGDLQIDRNRSYSDSNGNGTFVFTGIYTSASAQPYSGSDFADFLLGVPQQASAQFGPGEISLRGRSFSGFVNDDWRARSDLTLTLGLRYELLSPFVETSGAMANLDPSPQFTAVAPVVAGGNGPYSGDFPEALVEADTNNFAPRIGVAWRASRSTVLRAGYGISYNNGTYAAIARQLAAQPPFATSRTAIGSLSSLLLLETALTTADPTDTANSYAVDRNYALGRVQTWNIDLSRTFWTAWQAAANYTHTRGSNLDVVRAPNRGPDGLRISGVDPFLWRSSEGQSVLHSATFQVQRRPVNGLGATIAYTLARSRDNSPSIGGGAGTTVVAQNDQDLEAEWALSNFDRRHRLNANISYELPFGANRRWLSNGGLLASAFGEWRVNLTLTADAGTPLTARVQGATRDVASGINGALRADLTGQAIAVDNPTVDRFFNTSAFAVPAAGSFGTSARNVIIGPGSRLVNGQLSRDLALGDTRVVTLQLRVTNLLNDVNYGSVDTSVTSPTFGQVLSVRGMRAAQLDVRFRF